MTSSYATTRPGPGTRCGSSNCCSSELAYASSLTPTTFSRSIPSSTPSISRATCSLFSLVRPRPPHSHSHYILLEIRLSCSSSSAHAQDPSRLAHLPSLHSPPSPAHTEDHAHCSHPSSARTQVSVHTSTPLPPSSRLWLPLFFSSHDPPLSPPSRGDDDAALLRG